MIEDKQRWNKRYKEYPQPIDVEDILKKYYKIANVGYALDIACGMGRNTKFLSENGFIVDAVDISDYALSKIEDDKNINKIEADLDKYNLEENRYDLVVNINYLNRRFFPQIKDALKQDGVVIFKTFIVAHGDFKNPSNKEYLLRENELLNAFIDFNIIYYEEYIDTNLRGEKIKVAALVAKKKC